MRLRLPPRCIVLIAALAFFLPTRADAASIKICNHGNVAINVARAVYSESFFFGNSYRVSGWYVVDIGKCEVVYDADDPEAVYLGFTFLDAHGTLRTLQAEPEPGDDQVKKTSTNFCAGVGVPYDYTIKTKDASSCQDNFSPLEFTMYVSLGGNVDLSYGMEPSKFEGGPVFSGPTAAAKMMMGGEVRLSGNVWRLPDGTPLSDSLVNPQRKLPPLGPRQQYSVAKAPVAGYIKQITDVLTSVQSCNNTYLAEQVSHQGFAMDDRGVALSANTLYTSREKRDVSAMAIGDMDLANVVPVQRGECWELEIYCKDGSYCGQHNELPDSTATKVFDVYVDTREQATAILNALKFLTPYYPDAKPEIHQLQ